MIGKQLGHYEILRSLGRGGMGEVWEARDRTLERKVALKLLPPEMAGDPERLARFSREAKTVAALDHPNIVTIHSIEQAEGHHFITMQLVEGRTLADVIEGGDGQGLPVRRLFDVAVPLVEAVAAAHARGIAHRDLKPSNVMVNTDGRVMVLDFGLAKMLPTSSDDMSTLAGEVLTGEGKILGTVAYMSPEQAEGRPADERSDLFSLGVILYEMATGRRPFTGDTQMSVLTAIIRDAPVPATELRPTLPRQLGRIIEHCLEKDPAKRTQSAVDLRNELLDLRNETESGPSLSSGPAVAAAANARTRPVNRRMLGIGATVVIVAAGAWWLSGTLGAGNGEAIRDATTMAAEGRLDEAHALLVASGVDPAGSPAAGLPAEVSGTVAFDVQPSDSRVFVRRVTPVEEFAQRQAMSAALPVESLRLIAGEYHLTLEAAGHQGLALALSVVAGAEATVRAELPATDDATSGMVPVRGGPSPLDASVTVEEFLIDVTEVTNGVYLEFVSAGGYRDPALWPEEMIVDGAPAPAATALGRFVDRTGIPGPRDWSGGRYPNGVEAHPVTGISWYEATAYATWRGKRLPTLHEWWRAALGDDGRVLPWGNDVRTLPYRANLTGERVVPAGTFVLGPSPFGALDMAGNVREWVADEEGPLRQVTGGSWQDPVYIFDPAYTESFPAADARDTIGLRLARSVEAER